MVKQFNYNPGILKALERSFSTPRLTTYFAETHGNKQKAIELYCWNADISGALFNPLQGLEVTLRNVLHDSLSGKYNDTWYDNPLLLLKQQSKDEIVKAKSKLLRMNMGLTPPSIVAELSFGFWVNLLERDYHNTLWTPLLYKCFQGQPGQKRSKIFDKLNHLRKLRNRIAHHEPIFKRHLSADYQSIIDAVRWICPVTANWIDAQSSFPTILQQKP